MLPELSGLRRATTLLVALLVALVVLLLAPPLPGAAGEDEGLPETSVAVDGAVLRWGMSNEANNAAHAPGTYNFFSAGRVPDPGRGNVQLPPAAWSQSAGAVAIEKWDGTRYRPATWDGLSRDPDGVPITGPSSGRYSGHQFVFSGGTGTVDRVAGTARISWVGTVSVLAYSGYSFFYLSDPVLEVADGSGVLTGTLSGFGASREEPDRWQEIAPVPVTLADLPLVDLADAAGFRALPAYDGVAVSVGGAPYTGAFPQSFLDFCDLLGTAAFWHDTGSSTDPAKKALPLSVSYDAGDPLGPIEPEEQTPAPPIENQAPARPVEVVRTITRTLAAEPTTPAAGAPAPTPAPGPSVPQAEALSMTAPVALVSAGTDPAPSGSWLWWLGGVFLAAALVVTRPLLRTTPTP